MHTKVGASMLKPPSCAPRRLVRQFRGVVKGLRLPPLPSGDHLHIQLAYGVLGGAIWPSAVALCRHLSEQHHDWLSTSRPLTIEWGAGTGGVGLFTAALGARVVLTDVGPLTAAGYGGTTRLLQLLNDNAAANRALLGEGAEVSVAELDWAQKAHAEAVMKRLRYAPGGFELLLASDVIYSSAAHAPLARTIAKLLCTKNGVAFVAHEPRMFSGAQLASPGVTDIQLTAFGLAAREAGLSLEEVAETGVEGATAGTWHTVRIARLWPAAS